MYDDYAARFSSTPEGYEGFLSAGSAPSIASGRVAYTLGLEGPAVTIDTACSSSLVALHLAAQALRNGECDLALAGGVTVMATPAVFIGLSRQRGLAPDGRCKSFAAAADGAGFSEGAGLLLLERLTDAHANGHPVLAVIRGSAVNQDGASSQLSAPNGPSQERVIRAALAAARLSSADIDAVEAHGTGTTLGDPIEAQALLNTYGQDPARTAPLWLGSVKSNIGHTQAAAGVAGIIKIITAMQHGQLPKTLHVDAPTPHVDWDTGNIALLTDPQLWPADGRPRRAAVSSFGLSGTNAHLILEQAPQPDTPPATGGTGARDTSTLNGHAQPGDDLVLWPLSGRTPRAVRDAARRLQEWLDDHPSATPAQIGYSLAVTRTQFEHRAVLAGTGEEVRAGLAALAAGQPHKTVITGTAPPGGARPVLVFPGQGSQWPGMTADLLASSPVFAARIGECADALAPHTGWDLHHILTASPEEPGGLDLGSPAVFQPALWAVMTALAALWRHHGIEPAAVAGHSQGEIAAATVAGALTLDEAAALVTARSAVIAELAPPGAMASLAASQDKTADLIGTYRGQLSIAAVNGPDATVITGHPDAVTDLLARCAADGIRTFKLRVSHAAHNPALDAIRPQILAALPALSPRPAQIPFYSAVTGALTDTTTLDAAYWYDNLRQPVRFAQAITAALQAGHRLFIETSPHPILTPAITGVIDTTGLPATATGTLRRLRPAQFTTALATAHAHGATPRWDTLYPAGTSAITLPTYPFQHQPYWLHAPAAPGDLPATGLDHAAHPLLAAVTTQPDGTVLLTGRRTVDTAPWLPDHAVHGTVIVPGTALADLALHAATLAGTPHLAELTLQAPLTLPPDGGALRLQVTAGPPATDGRRHVTIHTQPASPDTEPDQGWTCHATGTATPAPDSHDNDQDWDWAAGTWPPPGAQPAALDGLYSQLADIGLDYGPAFQGLTAAWRHHGHLYTETALPDGTDPTGYHIHPALLDAALHAAALPDGSGAPVRLPISYTGLTLSSPAARKLRARLAFTTDDRARVDLADAAGHPVGAIRSLALRPADLRHLAAGGAPRQSNLFTPAWVPVPPGPAALPSSCAVVGASSAASFLAAALDAAGIPVATYPRLGALMAALDDGTPPPALLVSGPSAPGEADPPEAAATAVTAALTLLKGYLASPRLASVPLAWVTAGAAGPGPVTDLAAATTAGLIRSAQSEHPARITHLDLDPETAGGGGTAGALAAALAAGEPHVAVRGGTVLAPRLTRTTTPATTPDPVGTTLDPDGTVLITGGTGTLGAIIARHLAATGQARHLLLLSRRGPDAPGAAELSEDLETAGAETVITACDVASRTDLETALAAIPQDHPLTAVIHTAGTTSDATITTMTTGQIDPVMAPKATAAWHLHELTAGLPLAAFVLFSSAAGQLGAPGQGNYAAANTFLDALATWRHHHGLPAVSLAWGLWAQDSGITAALTERDRARLTRNGATPLPTADALAAYETALGLAQPVIAPVMFNWVALHEHARAGILAPVLRGLIRTQVTRPSADDRSLATRLAALDESGRVELIAAIVRDVTATALGQEGPEEVDSEKAFSDLGFTSLTAVEFRNQLNSQTGLRLSVSIVYDYPTPSILTQYLLKSLIPEQPSPERFLLTQLDTVEKILPELSEEKSKRTEIIGRLRAILHKLSQLDDTYEEIGSTGTDLQEATDQELFDVLDSELGIS